MALFAKSKVERFQDETYGSNLGPGDYSPTAPKPNAAGAVSMGFTAPKGLPDILREQVIEEETKFSASSVGAVHRLSVAEKSRRPSIRGPRSAASAAVARLGKVEAQQLARKLSWSEREMEKLQTEVAQLRQREAALIKSEKQACVESTRAKYETESLAKQVEAAERKALILETDAAGLKAAEAEAERLTIDAENARKVTALQTENDTLKTRVRVLEKRVEGFVEKEIELNIVVAASKERENALRRNRLKELGEASELVQEELKDVGALVNRGTGRAEERASKREEPRPGALEALASRMRSEFDAFKGSLVTSEDDKRALIEKIDMLDAEWKERVKILESELGVSRPALKAKCTMESEIDEMVCLECVETEATAYVENSSLEETLTGEEAGRDELQHELDSAREALKDATRRAASLEARLEESESVNASIESELDEVRSRLASSEDSRNKLQASMSATANSVVDLQKRLGDALTEGLEYADETIVSEERLRGSEADCAALWNELQEAKEQVRLAVLEGRGLASRLDKSTEEADRLREALREAEFRLKSTTEGSEELEEDLASSQHQCALLALELEKMRGEHADVSSETRLLKASCEEGRVEIARLREKLARAVSDSGHTGPMQDYLSVRLAVSNGHKYSIIKNQAGAHVQVETRTGGDYGMLEAKLREAKLTTDYFRSCMESTQMIVSEVQSDAQRSRFDLEDALRKFADLQERLREADDRLKLETLERRRAEEVVERVVKLQRESALSTKEEPDPRLEDTAQENFRFRNRVSACEGASDDRIDRQGKDVEECLGLLENDVGETSAISTAARKALEARVDELNSEAVTLRRVLAAKEAELDRVRMVPEETSGLLEDTIGRLEEMTGRLEKTTVRLQTTNVLAETKSRTMDSEAEGSRLMDILDDIEAGVAVGKETAEDLKQDLANVHGIGVEIAKRLVSMVVEKSKAMSRLGDAEASLVASEAYRRHLECELEMRGLTREGLNIEAEDLRKAHRAKFGIEAFSTEMGETGGLNNNMSRALTEGARGDTVCEAGLANQKDLNHQTARLLHDTASLSSELALATAVLEAVGILPKENADASDGTDSAAVASPPAMSRWKRGQSEESGSPEVTGKSSSGSNDVGRRGGNGSAGLGRTPSEGSTTESTDSGTDSNARTPRLSLQERLLRAIESIEPSRRGETRKPLQLLEATAGCFPSISCAECGDFCDVPAEPSSPTPDRRYLVNDRVKDELRRVVLQAQETKRGGGNQIIGNGLVSPSATAVFHL